MIFIYLIRVYLYVSFGSLCVGIRKRLVVEINVYGGWKIIKILRK